MILISKKYRLTLRTVAILLFMVLSYIRHSYYLILQAPFLVDKDLLSQESGIQDPALMSMLFFFVLFGVANFLVGMSFSFRFMKYLIGVYILLISVSALFYAISILTTQNWAFSFGSHVKNFCLGPVYPIAAYFIYKLKIR